MAGNAYLYSNAGQITELAAVQASAGAGDAGKIPALDAGGHLDISMMPTGVGAATATVLASAAIAAGDFVNVYNNAGTLNVRKADATGSGKEANGFCLSAIANAASGLVYFAGINTAVTGLTSGDVYLQTTAGTVGATCPTGSGNAQQKVGIALTATACAFQPKTSIIKA